MGTVFLLDQNIDAIALIERLKTQLELLSKLTPQEKTVFLNWVTRIIMRSIPQEISEEVSKLLEDNKEVETMVYNLEVALKREFSQRELKGKLEGKLEGLNEAKKNIAKKMLDKGISIEEVSDVTSLDVCEIEKIRTDIGH